MSQYKKDSKAIEKLSPLQHKVTQKNGTEPPFKNEFWDNKEPGLYVDIVSGEPLFASVHKFDSGTGWPSFFDVLEKENIVEKEDRKLFMKRTEVRSKNADSHLGHVFPDGPNPTGLRYCVNSAALKFVPVNELEQQGYGKYKKLFKSTEFATLAGGCFWGVEELFQGLDGVTNTTVGYTGGRTENPRYEDVKTGVTDHAEALQVEFDPTVLSYENLLRFFFRIHDPTTKNRQGNDAGSQYRSAIFFHSKKQQEIAEAIKAEVNQSGKWQNPVVTEITPASQFFSAEEYHQDYLKKNPGGYTCHFIRD